MACIGNDVNDKFAVSIASREKLGAGSFGTVFKVFDMLSKRHMACKEIDLGIVKVKEHQKELLKAMREVNAMNKLDHVNIVKYFGYEMKDGNQGPEFRILCIYMEYVSGGSVKDRLNKEGAFNETQAKKYTCQMLLGVSYLHEQHIIHRDLKCSNMLLDREDNIKLADLGIAKECHHSTHKSNRTRYTATCGTAHYMAPEVIAGEEYGRKADVWSAGATLVEMLTTKPPWSKLNDFQVMFRIGIKQKKPAYVLDSSLGPEVRRFLDEIFNYDSERRPSADELLGHDWFDDHRGFIYYKSDEYVEEAMREVCLALVRHQKSVQKMRRRKATCILL